jgi:hypothetical protein
MLAALYEIGSGGGGGGGYINGIVNTYNDLPVTIGTPAINSVYLVRFSTGIWLINRHPAGLYIRISDLGNLDDWEYLGTFPEVQSDSRWRVYNEAAPTKEVALDVSGVTSGVTRTLSVPNASGRIQVEGQPIGNTAPAAGTFTTLTANTSLAVAGGIITGASNVIEMVNASNTQTFRIYSSFSLANIFSRLSIRGANPFSGNHIIATEKGTSGGAAKGLDLQTDSVTRLTLGETGGVTVASGNLVVTDNTGGETATFDAQNKLTANRTYNLPNATGTIALNETFAAPPAIGSTTPAAGSFTTLSASDYLTASNATASPPTTLTAARGIQWSGLGGTFSNTASIYGSYNGGIPTFGIGTGASAGSTTEIAAFNSSGITFNNVLNIPDGSRTALPFRFTSETNNGFYRRGANTLTFVNGGSNRFEISGTQVRLEVNQSFGWVSNDLTGSIDLNFVRDAADTLGQRRGLVAQRYNLYGTFTSTTNFERLFLDYNATALAFRIGTEKGTSGSARALEFQTDGVTRMTLGATGIFTYSAAATFNVNTTGSGNNTLTLDNGGTAGSARMLVGAGGSHSQTITMDPRGVSTGQPTINAASNPAWLHLQTGATTRLSLGPSEANFTVPIIRIGGTTSLFPALKRSSTTLQVRLADDTDFAPLSCGALTLNGNLDASTRNIVTDTTTGTKIGTATTQKIGFFNATPVVQPTAVADATDAATVITQLNALLARVRTLGLIAN